MNVHSVKMELKDHLLFYFLVTFQISFGKNVINQNTVCLCQL